jgi:hypothetical protein
MRKRTSRKYRKGSTEARLPPLSLPERQGHGERSPGADGALDTQHTSVALAEKRDPGDLTTIEDPVALEQIRQALQ